MDEATKSEKAKPEILKRGGNGGKNRRKQRIPGVRAEDWKSIADCDAFLGLRHKPKNSSVSSGFSSVPSVFQDFWFCFLF
jgi:hypothetical protein